MDIQRLYDSFFQRFRPNRLQALYRTMGITAQSRVIDIGGGVGFWQMALDAGLPLPRVTIVNIRRTSRKLLPGMNWLCGDARCLPFRDQTFDVAVSNSVIEHLGDYASQQRFAAEARRVARRYFIQTPNLGFPVEPHFMAPFVHWLPRSIRPALLRFTPWALIVKPTAEFRRAIVEEIRLLGRSEMRRLFPEANVVTERFAGFPKSLIAEY